MLMDIDVHKAPPVIAGPVARQVRRRPDDGLGAN
jgi:hypothetical protein